MQGNGDWHMGWIGMGWWWILSVPLLIVAVWFVLSGVRRHGDATQVSPEQLLKRQYAKGDIDSAAYQRKLKALRK